MRLGRVFLFSLVLAGVSFAALFLLARGLITADPPFFDLRIGGYDDLTATRLYIETLEATGQIDTALTLYRWLDSVLPIGVFGLMTSALIGLWGRPAKAVAFLGCLVSLGYLIADFVENAAVAAMLKAGSAGVTLDMVTTASAATQGKWVAVFACLGLIALGLLVTLFRGGAR